MYAKIARSTWESGRPLRSTLQDCDFSFDHEPDCLMQGQSPQAPPLDCTCYVSRIRLVETPVGRKIPTTEPDLAPQLIFWRAEARRRKLWAATFLSIAVASSLLNVLYGLAVM